MAWTDRTIVTFGRGAVLTSAAALASASLMLPSLAFAQTDSGLGLLP